MFNLLNRFRFWISGILILVLGLWFLGVMLKRSGIDIFEVNEDNELLMEKAKQSYIDGAYQRTANIYEKILVMDPHNSDAVIELAIVYDDCLDRYDKAVLLYKKYMELVPGSEKEPLVKQWIKDAANRSLGKNITIFSIEREKNKELQIRLDEYVKENNGLKEEVEKLSSKLYTIQSEFQEEITSMQEERERLISEISNSKIRISNLTQQLAVSENSKRELLDKLEETIKDQKYSVYSAVDEEDQEQVSEQENEINVEKE